MNKPALLVLQDGSVFRGISIGADGLTSGEVVFNTAMTGYQEILTDPSYCRQIVTLTYPHIGNTGVNDEDGESTAVWAAGLVIRDLSMIPSSFRNQESLSDYLKRHNIVGIADIDTRRLTRILREKGAQNGAIIAGDAVDEAKAHEAAQAFPGLKGMDLAKVVTTQKTYAWTEGSWVLGKGHVTPAEPAKFKVVAYDFGVKHNILRMLVDRGCDVTVVPAQTPAADVLKLNPDGIFLSNGPGDPETVTHLVALCRELIRLRVPLLGICLGHQILGLAAGAKVSRLPFGHHGCNHPVMDLRSGKVTLTSQNHNFQIDGDSIPESSGFFVSHRNLSDQSVEGLGHRSLPILSVQYHPEAAPGPEDNRAVFDEFLNLLGRG